MCGIVGYIGSEQAAPIILDGLARLEYRGYDSSGIALFDGKNIQIRKSVGHLEALFALTDEGRNLPGRAGIGHTRWATHGMPNDVNSHPHYNAQGTIAVVHNGIIENYIPQQMEDILSQKELLQRLANRFVGARDVFFIGRGIDYATSMEGSLKLKEISYIHSEAYAAGELKHGTISLVEEGTLVIVLATQPDLFAKVNSNALEEKPEVRLL